MILYLIRHAKAEENHPEGDFFRRLSDRGIRRLQTLAKSLRGVDIQPQRHFSSPLIRALQTAEILMKNMGWKGQTEILDIIQPGSDVTDFPKFLQGLGQTERIALYTHNPYVQHLAEYLLSPNSHKEEIVFHTPSVLALDLPPPFQPHTAKFLWLVHHNDD